MSTRHEFKNISPNHSVIYYSAPEKFYNILDSEADAIVIPVNCVGVMGAGLAKQALDKYPEILEFYQDICKSDLLELGKVAVYRLKEIDMRQWIIFFPTKYHWRDQSQYEDVNSGLWAMRWVMEKMSAIKYVAVPKLGCGLGGLDWKEVSRMMLPVFEDTKTRWIIYGKYFQRET